MLAGHLRFPSVAAAQSSKKLWIEFAIQFQLGKWLKLIWIFFPLWRFHVRRSTYALDFCAEEEDEEDGSGSVCLFDVHSNAKFHQSSSLLFLLPSLSSMEDPRDPFLLSHSGLYVIGMPAMHKIHCMNGLSCDLCSVNPATRCWWPRLQWKPNKKHESCYPAFSIQT